MSPCVVLALKFGASEPRRNRGCSFVGVANERRRKGDAIVVREHWDARADGSREDGRAMRDAILRVGCVLGFRTNQLVVQVTQHEERKKMSTSRLLRHRSHDDGKQRSHHS